MMKTLGPKASLKIGPVAKNALCREMKNGMSLVSSDGFPLATGAESRGGRLP